jgi:hypothetical protein
MEHCMWYAPVGRFTMREEGDWLRLRTEEGAGQDVLRRHGEIREEWYARALAAFERYVNPATAA